MSLKLPNAIALSLIFAIVLTPAAAQRKRQTPAKPRQTQPASTQPAKSQPAKPQAASPKTQAAPADTAVPMPAPTFETLLPAETYKIYAEIRSVGQFVRSNSVNEIIEPIMKLAGPPKEFRTVVKWLNTHADEVMTSRMLIAADPQAKGIPNTLVAIEFASADEAIKFQQRLREFLDMMLPAEAKAAGETNPTQPPPPPPYHLQQAGALILITPTPLNLQNLRTAGSKLFAEDVNFRVAHNRFNSESIFIYFDVAAIEKEEAEQQKKYEEARKEYEGARKEIVVVGDVDPEAIAKAQAEAQKAIEEAQKTASPEPSPVLEEVPEEEVPIVGVQKDVKEGPQYAISAAPSQPPEMLLTALTTVFSTLSSAESTWPEAVGVGISLDGDSFDVRALLINGPGEKSDPLPFLPALYPGPAIAPEAPNILPADTEMLVMLSLDLPRILETFAKPPAMKASVPAVGLAQTIEIQSPLEEIEKKLKIKIKDDLLPLLGSEVAVSVPLTGFDWFQPPQPPQSTSPASPSPSPASSPNRNESGDNFTLTETTRQPLNDRSVVVLLSLKDKEGMRTLLPKLIDAAAFKGASALAQTERREDTELVSYVNMFAYAFIGNFLVVSPDVATTRRVVDSYLKHQTLSGDPHFKNYTRWQPRQLHAQVYLSQALMESYKTWINQPTTPIDEKMRMFLNRFSVVPQPVTYSLSNEGFGPLHELHVPKNLVLIFVASMSSGINAAQQATQTPPPPVVAPPDPKPPVEQPPKLPSKP